MKTLVKKDNGYELVDSSIGSALGGAVINPVILQPQSGAQSTISAAFYLSLGLAVGIVCGTKIPGFKKLSRFRRDGETLADAEVIDVTEEEVS